MKIKFHAIFKKCKNILLFSLIFTQFNLFADTTESNKTVLITGAAGFIGSNFLEYMFKKHENYNFIVLDALTYAGNINNIPKRIQKSDRFRFVKDSITNFDVVNELMKESDFVVHFAAESHVGKSISDGHAFFDTNVMGTFCMVKALMQNLSKVERFIHISTSEVYGTADYVPMDENHPLKPKSPYAASKSGADRLIYGYISTFDLPIVTIRPFNNYGPRQHTEKMIPRFISQALSGKPITIHGDGEQQRDWIHTSDVSAAIDAAIHSKDFSKIKNQELNVATGVAISVKDIAKIILKKLNLPESKYLTFIPDRPGQVQCHWGSTEKSKDLLGWEAKIDIEQGLEKTIQWYKNHPEYCMINEEEV